MNSFIIDMTEGDIRKERSIARELRKSIWWKRKCADGKCYYCNSTVSPENLTMDHIVPIVRGGRSIKSNIVTACKECNNKKKYLLPIEWDEYLYSM
ncbi:MAG: HNH endonuclease [Thermodesulfovibrionales bacterium]|nr:HNH endonuclease [Thermodesulfovibrionales bacterium]